MSSMNYSPGENAAHSFYRSTVDGLYSTAVQNFAAAGATARGSAAGDCIDITAASFKRYL